MYDATLKVIESNNPDYVMGSEHEGMTPQIPRKGMIFFMYLNEPNPTNKKKYIYLDDIVSVRFLDNEFVVHTEDGVFALKIKEPSPEQEDLLSFMTPSIVIDSYPNHL